MHFTYLTILTILFSYVFCEECLLHYKPIPEYKKQLLNRIASLKGPRYIVKSEEATYEVTICKELYPNAAATKRLNTDKSAIVIGRFNDSHIVGGSDWILLTYGSGDIPSNSDHCRNTSMKTSIMIACNRESDRNRLSLSEDDAIGDCHVTFTLKTAVICPNIPKGLSKGSVFCVLLVTGGIMYLIVGVAYRRIMTGAQGVEQIPHYSFWRDLGNLQADGCNFVCRKGNGRDESWNRITSNFNDPADEPLLHP